MAQEKGDVLISCRFRNAHRCRELPFVLAAVVFTAWPLAASDPGAIGAEEIGRIRRVTDVQVSPDGDRIAYVLSVPRDPFQEENGSAWSELHVVGPGGTSRPFVSGSVKVGAVRWTPGGREISFLAKRGDDEHKALYRIPVDGGEARRALAHASDIEEYDYSDDGKRLAFLAREKKDEKREELKEKGFNAEVFEEDWRPVKVWIHDPGGDGEPRSLDLPGSASELHWAPGGKRLIVALAPTPLVDQRYMRRRLHVVDADTGEILAKIDNPGKLGEVAWSPDGKYVGLISGADLHDPREGRLMMASAEGGEPRDLLSRAYPGHVQSFAWRGSGAIVYVSDVGVSTTVNEVDFLAEERAGLVAKGRVVLSDVSLSADGAVAAFLGETAGHPAEVFRMERGTLEPRRLTDSNPWLADVDLAPQEVVNFRARDGMELEGILIRPRDEQPGRRYPLVMIVHGGPESHHRNGWQTSYSRPAQLLAARGFAVFFTNYRGSTGRGVEFSKLSQGDPAGKEFDDLVDAVNHLVKIGLVDRQRVGITGGSYGGYATAWGATRLSEHFAAGVMFVGISDLLSKVGTSDIPEELYLVHMRKRPWDDWQEMLERSPIYHTDKARTPLLILHGKDDPRVFPGQSLELYRYLKIRNQAPVRLVYYPGEGHGNRKAAGRLDYTLRLVRWMEHYLKGPKGDPPPYELDYGQQEEETEAKSPSAAS